MREALNDRFIDFVRINDRDRRGFALANTVTRAVLTQRDPLTTIQRRVDRALRYRRLFAYRHDHRSFVQLISIKRIREAEYASLDCAVTVQVRPCSFGPRL